MWVKRVLIELPTAWSGVLGGEWVTLGLLQLFIASTTKPQAPENVQHLQEKSHFPAYCSHVRFEVIMQIP